MRMTARAGLTLVFAAVGGCSLFIADDGYVGPPDGGAAEVAADAAQDGSFVAQIDAGGDSVSPCAAGSALVDGGCAFVNPFRDPSFQGTPANAWTISPEAKLDPTGAGAFDPGFASLIETRGDPGTIAQTIDIPAQAVIGPLALDVKATTETAALDPGDLLGVYAGGRLVGEVVDAVKSKEAHATTLCLGERAHGTGVSFMFAPRVSEIDRLFLDHVAIRKEPTCPAPGTVVNGNFEGTGGWMFSTPLAQVTPDTGTNATRGGELKSVPTAEEAAELTGILSVPGASMTSPALRFRTYGNAELRLKLAGKFVARLRSDGTRTTQTVCLPAWSRGSTMKVSFVAAGADFYPWPDTTVAIDDVQIVSVPACDDVAEVQNPGLETAGNPALGWYTTGIRGGVAARKAGTTPLPAHTGAAYLSLSIPACGGTEPLALASQVVSLPAATAATGGVAVKFWYRLSGSDVIAEVSGETLTNKTAWTQGRACLAPGPAGARREATFRLAGFGPCTAATLDVDDVTLANDTECFP